mgnify:CR=1 FL=1
MQPRTLTVLATVERVPRAQVAPDKVDLASPADHVLHPHRHVISRWRRDGHLPKPVRGGRQRVVDPPAVAQRPCTPAVLGQTMVDAVAALEHSPWARADPTHG